MSLKSLPIQGVIGPSARQLPPAGPLPGVVSAAYSGVSSQPAGTLGGAAAPQTATRPPVMHDDDDLDLSEEEL